MSEELFIPSDRRNLIGRSLNHEQVGDPLQLPATVLSTKAIQHGSVMWMHASSIEGFIYMKENILSMQILDEFIQEVSTSRLSSSDVDNTV